ncbi:hypothetical protein JL720_3100 [Aureococcus anophagefferens]|nr:hypothetical protein JL720_3100 [Aureococcus anophagefferens]
MEACRALYEYQAAEADELTIKEGDLVQDEALSLIAELEHRAATAEKALADERRAAAAFREATTASLSVLEQTLTRALAPLGGIVVEGPKDAGDDDAAFWEQSGEARADDAVARRLAAEIGRRLKTGTLGRKTVAWDDFCDAVNAAAPPGADAARDAAPSRPRRRRSSSTTATRTSTASAAALAVEAANHAPHYAAPTTSSSCTTTTTRTTAATTARRRTTSRRTTTTSRRATTSSRRGIRRAPLRPDYDAPRHHEHARHHEARGTRSRCGTRSRAAPGAGAAPEPARHSESTRGIIRSRRGTRNRRPTTARHSGEHARHSGEHARQPEPARRPEQPPPPRESPREPQPPADERLSKILDRFASPLRGLFRDYATARGPGGRPGQVVSPADVLRLCRDHRVSPTLLSHQEVTSVTRGALGDGETGGLDGPGLKRCLERLAVAAYATVPTMGVGDKVEAL